MELGVATLTKVAQARVLLLWLTTLLPYYLTTVLPYYRTTVLPYYLTHLLPYLVLGMCSLLGVC